MIARRKADNVHRVWPHCVSTAGGRIFRRYAVIYNATREVPLSFTLRNGCLEIKTSTIRYEPNEKFITLSALERNDSNRLFTSCGNRFNGSLKECKQYN